MRLSSLLAGATLAFATTSQALNILLNNDDGFGSANLREVYRLLKKDGHDGKETNSLLWFAMLLCSLLTASFASVDCRPSSAPERTGRPVRVYPVCQPHRPISVQHYSRGGAIGRLNLGAKHHSNGRILLNFIQGWPGSD
jgi:hypothetical protein